MTLSEQIAELLSYYINGETNRRCVTNKNHCFYSGTNVENETEGCFIGKMLKPEDRIKADNYFKVYIDTDSYLKDLVRLRETIGIEIPQLIMDNQDLFGKLQRFHDSSDNWNDNGTLKLHGIAKLKYLIKDFYLDEKDFEKFFVEPNKSVIFDLSN